MSHRPQGPRVIFKDDRDSAIGRGAILFGAHFRPEVAAIIKAAADTAPHYLDEITVSEAWRDIRDTRDLHEEARAFDLSLHGLVEGDAGERHAQDWAQRIRDVLGADYTVVVHGEGSNRHIHIELDP